MMVPTSRGAEGRKARIFGAALVGIAAAWWSFAATARQVLYPVHPSIGLLGMVDAQAEALAASNLVAPGSNSAQLAQARKLALAALDREPGNVVAARTMALLAAAEKRTAAYHAWLAYSESLSRRDVITQFALIENNVAAGNVQGALRHYNRAMLVNVSSRDTLLPILIPAVGDMVVAQALVPFLQRRPAWWPHFVGALNGGGTNPAAIRLILQTLRLDPNNPSEADALGAGIARMVALGDLKGAYAFYRSIRKPSPAFIQDGGFERENAFGPFEWTIADGADGSSASRQERTDGRGLALFVSAGASDSVVAQQSAPVTPGAYVLAARLVPDSPSAPAMWIRVRCATGTELAKLVSNVPQAVQEIRTIRFQVPEGCPLTKIAIGVDAASAGQAAGWIDDVAIKAV